MRMIFFTNCHFSKKKKENVKCTNIQTFGFPFAYTYSMRVYSRQYIKPFGFRLDFYHSTIVFLRIKKIDIPPSETLFDSFFFFLFSPNVVRFRFTLPSWNSRDSCFVEKKKIISPSKHVTLAYFQRLGCLFSALYPLQSDRWLSKRLTMERRASFSRFQRALRPGILLFPAGKFSERKWSNAPEEFNNGRYTGTWSFKRVFRETEMIEKASLSKTFFFFQTWIHSIG